MTIPVIVRFGYVAISLKLKNASPNRTITYKSLSKLPPEEWHHKLAQLTRQNLTNQLRILKHNVANDIRVYRFTSNLVPLATHASAEGWKYWLELADEFRTVGDYVKQYGLRVSFHPDHFVNIHSPDETVRRDSVRILKHHYLQSRAMGLGDEVRFNIHIGGAYGDKQRATERFIEAWGDLPAEIQARITLENDDKTYTAVETLSVCQKIGIPMVFDVHHHNCNPGDDASSNRFPAWLTEVFNTWEGTGLCPKVHASSPRGESSASEYRSHAEYVSASDLLPFLHEAAQHLENLDVMLEAKAKDEALFQLMEELRSVKGITVLDGASIEVHD